MNARRNTTLGPSHARVPEALSPFLAAPDRPIPYRWWTRLLDHWAGRRDRTAPLHDSSSEIVEADTPWLRRLAADWGVERSGDGSKSVWADVPFG